MPTPPPPTPRPSAKPRPDGFQISTAVLASLMLVGLILPVLALFWRSFTAVDRLFALDLPVILAALWLSLSSTAVTVLLIVLLGTPLAYLFARYQFPAKRLLVIFVELPIVMPPVVAGLALLAAFGRRGLLGSWLADWGITIPFTWTAVVLAQLFVAAPFYIRAAQARFAALPRDLEEAAHIDGANAWQTFRYITLPLSWRALLSGLSLSWARALGEFGATILFAGNLTGRTQTMTLLVYSALERNLYAAYATAVLLLILAAAALFLTRWLSKLDEIDQDPLAS